MKFAKKNDAGIEIHLDKSERELVYNALRHFSAYGANESYIVEQVPKICEILNVLDLPEFSSIER